jgi:phage head maturation protease
MLEDQDKGLYMKAEMPLDDPEINAAYKKIKFMIDRGAKMGLSIGYDTIKSMPGEDGTRLLKEVALHEVSVTPFPMNTEAQIMAAKSRKSKSRIKQALWQKTITRPRRPVKRSVDDYTSLLGDIKNLINEFKNL